MMCLVQGCGAQAKRKGMCTAHYQRAWKYGDPSAGCTPKGALNRFLRDHVHHTSDDCLKWPYGGKGNGYGSLKFRGRKTTASKAMCILAHGEPPTVGHEAAHSCGNGHLGCVNPRHLRWATRLENVHDAMRDGTNSRGAKHSAAIKQAFAKAPRAVRREAKREGVPVETLTEEAGNAA